MKRLLTVIALILCSFPLTAQITQLGEDPDSLKWMSRKTEHYRLIFPQQLRQNDVDYMSWALEFERERVGRSVGMTPGQYHFGRTPVILHPANIYANGSMLWTPKRMDIYTISEPYDTDPMPWLENLSIHESRHLAQLQFGYRKPFRPLNYIFGELWPGALVGLYTNMAIIEGDAVAAETGLSLTGRGRTADFLNYMQVAFDRGDWRNFYRWQYGSFKRYTPDYYKLGYLTVAGARTLYDDPLFSARYFNNARRHPLHIGNMKRTLKQASGKKFRKTFREIEEYFHDIWEEEAEAREPFLTGEPLAEKAPRFPEIYRGLTAAEGAIFAVKAGYSVPSTLVRIDPETKEEEALGAFAPETSALRYDAATRRIYWTESRSDIRWTLAGTSVVCYYDLADGSRHQLTSGTRYFNPTPLGDTVAVVDYPVEGGTTVVLIDASTGEEVSRMPLAWNLYDIQITEVARLDGTFYALGLNMDGFAVWRYEGGEWKRFSSPTRAKVRQLRATDDALTFVADIDGSNEWYRMDPATGETVRLTSLRYGGTDFVCCNNIWYTATTATGKSVFSVSADSLAAVPVEIYDVHRYPVADKLSEQEKALVGVPPALRPYEEETDKPYHKGLHLVKIHSWAPVCFDYDAIESLSGDITYDVASLGATVLFQNDLGSSYGTASYGVAPAKGGWRHSGHLKYTYTGLWPVIEATVDIGDRSAGQTTWKDVLYDGDRYAATSFAETGNPLLHASLQLYVPLNFSGGGYSRGVIPLLKYSVSNDLFNRGTVGVSYIRDFDGDLLGSSFTGAEKMDRVPVQSLQASIRAYAMRGTALSEVYPSFGGGVEIGYSGLPGLTGQFSDNIYFYGYGYLPGILEEQGLRLTFRAENSLRFGTAIGRRAISCAPRGMDSAADDYLAGRNAFRTRLTADYAIPFWLGDISFLSPMVYIKNFVFTPHFDMALAGNTRDYDWTGRGTAVSKGLSGPLYSAGFDFTANIANLFWVPFDGNIGFRLDWNGGLGSNGRELFNTLKEGHYTDPFHFELLFSMDI